MSKNEIHYMDRVEVLVSFETDNQDFIDRFDGNIVHAGHIGRVKEIKGSRAKVDIGFIYCTISVYLNTKDLRLLPIR